MSSVFLFCSTGKLIGVSDLMLLVLNTWKLVFKLHCMVLHLNILEISETVIFFFFFLIKLSELISFYFSTIIIQLFCTSHANASIYSCILFHLTAFCLGLLQSLSHDFYFLGAYNFLYIPVAWCIYVNDTLIPMLKINVFSEQIVMRTFVKKQVTVPPYIFFFYFFFFLREKRLSFSVEFPSQWSKRMNKNKILLT